MTAIRGDALEMPFADGTIDLIIASPPYWSLRDYEDDGGSMPHQVGGESHWRGFLDNLDRFMVEARRVLAPWGNVFVNLGDKMAGSGSHNNSGVGADVERGPAGSYLQAADIERKSLVGLPWRFAIRQIDAGWILRSEIIWDKPNPMPETVQDRVARSHEQWFHFAKQQRHFAAIDALRRPYGEGTAERYAAGYGDRSDLDDARLGVGLESGGDDWQENDLGALPRSVWRIPTEGLRIPAALGFGKHYAPFPIEWPERLIAGFAPEGICLRCKGPRRRTYRRQRMLDGEPYDGETWNKAGRDGHRVGAQGVGHWRFSLDVVEDVLRCECNEIMRTPRGSNGGPDPSRSTGRAGMNRPRSDDAGVRELTRWDQRHHAEQMRRSPHRAEMATVAGAAAFDHYIRTDIGGARPLPQQLLEEWLAAGWLQPVPVFEHAPMRPAVVLDPFGGTGTTATAARAAGRLGISMDLSGKYSRIAQWRIFESKYAWRERQETLI